MRRRWPLLALVLGLAACFNLQPSSSSSNESCDTTSPGLVFEVDDGGNSNLECISAGGACQTGGCSDDQHAATFSCDDGLTSCCLPDTRDASTDASNDAGDGGDAGEGDGGLCNLVACQAGCTCALAEGDAGGGVCLCPGTDTEAGTEAGGQTSGDAGAESGVVLDGAATDAGSTATLCGVLWCAQGCVCMRSQDSECQCP